MEEDTTTNNPDLESDQNLNDVDTNTFDEHDEDVTTDEEVTLEDYIAVKAQLEKETKDKEKFQRLFDNARKATKTLKDNTNNNPPNQPIDKEELILYARNFEESDIEIARKVAQVEGISLIEASKSDLFRMMKERQDLKLKSEKAQIPPSRGSSRYQAPKSFENATTEEEHRELFNKTMGKM
jgi:hypothetical protein